MKEITKEIQERFYNLFGEGLLQYVHPVIGFDLIKFDDHLKCIYGNYEDGKTSMEMFIKRKYGKEAVELIKELCNIK